MTNPPDSPPPPPTPSAAPKRAYIYRGEGTSWYQPVLWVLGRWFSRLLTLILFRFRARGVQNVPRRGPVLLVANHQSFLDPWLMGVWIKRQIHFMARDSLFKDGFLGWLIVLLNTFPVRRGTADLGAVRTAIERLEKGFVVNIFAEGTRTTDGTIQPIITGALLVVRRCKVPVPVVPVVVDGAFEAWPRTSKYPQFKRIRMIYGKPIMPEEYRDLPPEEFAQRLRREMVALQKELGSVHAERSAARMEAENTENK